MKKGKNKKNNKNKNKKKRPSVSSDENSGLTWFALAILIFAIIGGYVLKDRFLAPAEKPSTAATSTFQESKTTPASLKVEDESALTPVQMAELRKQMKPRYLKKHCYDNGKCMKLRPWKTKKKIKVPEGCKDLRPTCSSWAKAGQCDTNPGWMIVYCPVACKACHLRKSEKRCQRQNDQIPILAPGGIKENFLTLKERFPQYEPELLKDGEEDELYFAVLKNFLTEKETSTLIEWLEKMNPKRSTTQTDAWADGGIMEQSHNDVRTSENAWCTQACWQDDIVLGVVAKIQNITGVPPLNYENFQLVRYTEGQFYRTHNDCNPKDNTLTQTAGHRIYTVFLYLNDVEEGGATDFPTLKQRVYPKRGWAAFWPDVKNLNPEECDLRYRHHAMDVTKGMKYGANIWVHQYDYQTSALWGCTGSFEG